jgi:hypothetical protein
MSNEIKTEKPKIDKTVIDKKIAEKQALADDKKIVKK